MTRERWKDLENFDGLYKVSNLGRIKSVTREVPGRYGNVATRIGMPLKLWTNSSGCKQVTIRKDMYPIMVHVGRSVANAFVRNRKGYKYVSYRDGNPANCAASNLVWVEKKGKFNAE